MRLLVVFSIFCFSLNADAGLQRKASRAQIGAHLRHDIWAGSKPNAIGKQPLLNRSGAWFRGLQPGARKKLAKRTAERFKHFQRRHPGKNLTELTEKELPQWELFRHQKLLTLKHYNRNSDEIREGVIRAKTTTIEDVSVGERDVFVQIWRAGRYAKPSGTVVVIAPGMTQTGRNFYGEAEQLNKFGHDVIIMDQQWGGYSISKSRDGQSLDRRGTFDSLHGIARDVAATTAYAAELGKQLYGGRSKIVISATSMGSTGALKARTLADSGLMNLELSGRIDGVDLNGLNMPHSVPGIHQATFLESSRSLGNATLSIVGRIPLLKDAPLIPVGYPRMSRVPMAEARFADQSVMQDLRVRAKSMVRANPDIQAMKTSGELEKLKGFTYFAHAENDPLASSNAVSELVKSLKNNNPSQVKYHRVESNQDAKQGGLVTTEEDASSHILSGSRTIHISATAVEWLTK